MDCNEIAVNQAPSLKKKYVVEIRKIKLRNLLVAANKTHYWVNTDLFKINLKNTYVLLLYI